MAEQNFVMRRGVYLPPWRDEETGRPVVVLIDHRHRKVHEIGLLHDESEQEALQRAANLLEVFDPPRRPKGGAT